MARVPQVLLVNAGGASVLSWFTLTVFSLEADVSKPVPQLLLPRPGHLFVKEGRKEGRKRSEMKFEWVVCTQNGDTSKEGRKGREGRRKEERKEGTPFRACTSACIF
jgi:hypothetical protein